MPVRIKKFPVDVRAMSILFNGLDDEVLVYVDDCIIFADNLDEHDEKFKKVAERLRAANMRLQPEKCEFYRTEVSFLGHIISVNGVKPDPKKVSAVNNFPRPKNTTHIQQFLGLIGYYRRFIVNFSKEAKALTCLLKKERPRLNGQTNSKPHSNI